MKRRSTESYRALIASSALVFGITGAVLVWVELGPLAAGGIVSLFIGWAVQRQLRDQMVVDAVNDLLVAFRAEQERITIHLLYEGLPLCGFTHKLPRDWPNNTRWVSVLEFDRHGYTGDDVCLGCLAELDKDPARATQ